jgi:hypothetical protein
MNPEREHEAVLAAFTTMSDAWAQMDAAQFAGWPVARRGQSHLPGLTDDSARSPGLND